MQPEAGIHSIQSQPHHLMHEPVLGLGGPEGLSTLQDPEHTQDLVITGEWVKEATELHGQSPSGFHPQPEDRAEMQTPGHLPCQRRVCLQGGL